jgi:hypothetical protein
LRVPTLDPTARLHQLRALAQTLPELGDWETGYVSPEAHVWLGRLYALVKDSGDTIGAALVQTSTVFLAGYGADQAATEIVGVLHRTIGVAELQAPAGAAPAFIPAGNSFDTLAAVGRVFGTAKKSLLIVDPYMDERTLTEFSVQAAEGVTIYLLSDEATVKPGLKPMSTKWQSQYGDKRPLEVRLSTSRALHDRLVVVDNVSVWTLTQSFKDIAIRSPASLIQIDAETAILKTQAYYQLWSSARPIN